jgi:hypothetical protein
MEIAAARPPFRRHRERCGGSQVGSSSSTTRQLLSSATVFISSPKSDALKPESSSMIPMQISIRILATRENAYSVTSFSLRYEQACIPSGVRNGWEVRLKTATIIPKLLSHLEERERISAAAGAEQWGSR